MAVRNLKPIEDRDPYARAVLDAFHALESADSCANGCAGCEDCIDDSDESRCPCCDGDGMDPMNDYVLTCPACGGMG